MKRLSNSIPVLFHPLEGGVATFHWWVLTGSCYERPREEGFAHFLEHMLFKDASAKESGRASAGLLAQGIESFGGDINAYTSLEQTVYHFTSAEKNFEKALDLFGTMGKPRKFLKTDFEREREVILEELRKNEDSPGRKLFESLFQLSFPKHPYGRPVIGFSKTLKNANVKDLESFFNREYVSDHMGLVVVAPLGKNNQRISGLMKILEKRFGEKAIAKRSSIRGLSESSRFVAPLLNKQPQIRSIPFGVQNPSLGMAFLVPELTHPDVPALDVLSGILGSGETSRLFKNLFQKRALVTEVSSGVYIPSDPGILYIEAELDSVDKLDETIRAIGSSVREIEEKGVEDFELKRVLAHVESEKIYATQTVDGLASRIGSLYFVLKDLDFDRRYIESLRRLSSNDLSNASKKYLRCESASLALLTAKDQPYAVEKLKNALVQSVGFSAQNEKKHFTGASTDVSESDKGVSFLDYKRPSGLRVVHLRRPGSDVFSIYSVMFGGTRLETIPGLSQLLGMTWTSGTKDHDSHEISKIVEGRAAQMDGFSGWNSVGLELTGLKKDWSTLSHLFAEVLTRPVFPESEVNNYKRVAKDSLLSLPDHSAQLGSALFLEALYEDHPYGRHVYGTVESLDQITSHELQKLHRSWVQPDRVVLSLVGDLSTQEVDQLCSQIESELKNFETSQTPSPVLKVPVAPKGPRWAERSLNREQVHLLVGSLGVTQKSEDRFPLRVLQTLLSGQGGRLFLELREKKSLAYSIGPVSVEGVEPGYFAVYMASAPGKKSEGLKGIQAVMESVAKKGAKSAELSRAKEYYLGHLAMDLQSFSSQASALALKALYGHKPYPFFVNDAEIRKVSEADIKRVCKKYWLDQNHVTSTVG